MPARRPHAHANSNECGADRDTHGHIRAAHGHSHGHNRAAHRHSTATPTTPPTGVELSSLDSGTPGTSNLWLPLALALVLLTVVGMALRRRIAC
ncbi:hypothetical protein [Candidatus Amarolinea dominans]|uniref:hypothetical protein n=1 Tax=Candidatus Amarolinea dominans TaxID=3140696 RepID=UPI001D1EE3B2|nr:hypothetical protein [Anaerolineae bacterium]